MTRLSRRDDEINFLSWPAIFLVFSLWVNGLSGCSNDNSSSQPGSTPTGKKEGKLYIANGGDGSLIAFDQAASAQGNLSPSRHFPESITGPTGIFLDQTNDILYITNTDHNSILIYENASTLNLSVGSAEATRVISGPHTGLDHPYGVVYDASRDRLYVTNRDSNSISVFQKDCPQPNTLNGDIAPCRTLSGNATSLKVPQTLTLDTQRDILYIANLGDSTSASDDSILVYENASLSTTLGNLAPTRTITPHNDSSQTESILNSPAGLFIDSTNDRLVVVNSGGSQPAIFIYESASTRSGGTIPDRLLVGQNTQLSSPAGIDFSVGQDRLYVLNNNNTNNSSPAIMVFENFNVNFNGSNNQCTPSRCNIGPDRIISGQNTGLANPTGIAYDPKREIVYVANTLGNDILIFTLEGNLPPLKVNSGDYTVTGLMQPNAFYYDQALDRLYIANFNSSSAGPTQPHIIVYEQVSTKSFATTKFDWGLRGTDIQQPRGVYLDKTRGVLLILSSQNAKLLLYDFSSIGNPTAGQVINLPSPLATFSGASLGTGVGFDLGTAMAVDESRAEAYIVDDCVASSDCPNFQPYGNSIYIYKYDTDLTTQGIQLTDDDLGTPAIQKTLPNRIIGHGCKDRNNGNPANRGCETTDNTKLNRPYGIFYDSRGDSDPQNDILYVTNIGATGEGANSILAFNNPGSLGNTLTNCDAFVNNSQNQGTPSPCNIPPNRVISSAASFTDAQKLKSPTAPYVNPAADRLFLINWGKDEIFIFEHASTLSGSTRPDRIVAGTNTLLTFSAASNTTGALFVDTSQGKETLYVGEPRPPGTCSGNTCLNGTLLVFGVQGNAPPSRTWSGGGAALIGPSALALDPNRDILYVANAGDVTQTTDDSLSIFTKASQANGNLPMTGSLSVTSGSATVTGTGTIFTTEFVIGDSIKIGTATYTISSIDSDTSIALTTPYSGATASDVPASLRPRTLCSPSSTTCGAPDVKLNNPAGLLIDTERNHLYISNAGSDPNCGNTTMPCNTILVFHAASNLSNNGVPDQVLTSTSLNSPRGLALDTARNILYVANNGGHSVLAFKNVIGRTGAVTATPDAEIGGIATGINAPVGVAIDSGRDILYVLNQGTPGILVYAQSSAQNGNSAPTRTISGSFMTTPSALFLDPGSDTLYVADKGTNAVYAFTGASQAQGAADHRTLSGNNTALNQPAAIFVDTTR